MTCAQCGSTMPEGTAACSVCNPWAVPAASGTHRPAVLADAPKATGPIPVGPIPKWITKLAKRNPPGTADLEKAWRNTAIVSAAATLFCFCEGVAVLIESLQSTTPALSSLIRVLVWIPIAAFAVCTLLFRGNMWLGRAIAVVGTRPDIGYAGFARLPGITRITAMNRWIIVVFTVMALSWLAMDFDHGLSRSDRTSVFAVYFFVLVPLSLCQLLWQASARRDLRRLLTA